MLAHLKKTVIIIATMAFVVTCATSSMTPQERAELNARLKASKIEEAKRVTQQKHIFEEDVRNKTEEDGTAPERVDDPGYPIVNCISPKPSPSYYAIKVPPIGKWSVIQGVICENTDAGKKVLEWREWYCGTIEKDIANIRDCVVSWWGHKYKFPGKHYGIVENKKETFGLSEATKITIGQPRWQPTKK